MHADTFRSTAKTLRHRTGTLSVIVASHPSSLDRSIIIIIIIIIINNIELFIKNIFVTRYDF